MAIHSFTCAKCKIKIEDTVTEGIHKCPECGGDMKWDVNIFVHGNYHKPIHSDSLAIHPSQRAEHERLFPNIKLDNECRPIFDNFTNHEAYLKKTGFQKLPQKIKRAGAKRIV